MDQSVLREIEDEAFYDTGIESIELPQSLTLIRQKAFKSCDYLENVTLHSVTLDIHKEAFYNDDKLKSINLNNVRYIGVEALYNTKVTDLDLSSAEHIEKYAYVGGSLHSVKFSHNLVMLHDKAFVTNDMVIFPNEYYHFFDTHHTEMGQCAELMHGKTFVRGEGKTLVQVL